MPEKEFIDRDCKGLFPHKASLPEIPGISAGFCGNLPLRSVITRNNVDFCRISWQSHQLKTHSFFKITVKENHFQHSLTFAPVNTSLIEWNPPNFIIKDYRNYRLN